MKNYFIFVRLESLINWQICTVFIYISLIAFTNAHIVIFIPSKILIHVINLLKCSAARLNYAVK